VRNIGEIVLIHIGEKAAVYARVEAIETDIKPGWYQLNLLLLTWPQQSVNWILREEYMDGETFTIDNIPVQIIPLAPPGHYISHGQDSSTKTNKDIPQKSVSSGADIVSLDEIRKKKENDIKDGS